MLTTPRAIFAFTSLIIALGAICGCQVSPQPTGPTTMQLRISDPDAFFDSAMTLLRERDFEPKTVDRREGMLVTSPTTGQQWFEFWRSDSRGGYQLLESSLHTIRRYVVVTLRPAPNAEGTSAGGNYELMVEVQKQRYSAPERQIATASSALAIYSERLPTTEGLRAAHSAGAHWVPLGRDQQLELALLDKFAAVSSVVAADEPRGR